MNLQQQLEYFWERGFYSVVEDDRHQIRLVTTKSYQDSLSITAGCDSIELAKRQIGFSYSCLEDIDGDKSRWQIVELIHPSELMGKGFQVGDKVKVIDGLFPDRVYTILRVLAGNLGYRLAEDDTGLYAPSTIKPVLPTMEEEKKGGCEGCGEKEDHQPFSMVCAVNMLSKLRSKT